jgi:hypothetical protein
VCHKCHKQVNLQFLISVAPMKIYLVEREGFDYTEHTLIFLNRNDAIDAMLRHALSTRCVVVVLLFESREDISQPFQHIETVHLETLGGYYRIWLKQDELNMSTENALDNLSLFHDTIQSVPPYISQSN